MIITTVNFKRSQADPWEYGYAIGKDVGDIITITTKEGELVSVIWNYKIPRYPDFFIQHEFK